MIEKLIKNRKDEKKLLTVTGWDFFRFLMEFIHDYMRKSSWPDFF